MAAISRSRNSGSGHTEVDTQKISPVEYMVRVSVTGNGGRKRVGPRPNQAQRAQIRLAERAEREGYRRAAGSVILNAMLRHKLRRLQASLAVAIRRRDSAVKIQRLVRRRNALRNDIIDLT